MEATHLTSMACKFSATDCPDVCSGKRRGREVKSLGANGCLVAKDLMSRIGVRRSTRPHKKLKPYYEVTSAPAKGLRAGFFG